MGVTKSLKNQNYGASLLCTTTTIVYTSSAFTFYIPQVYFAVGLFENSQKLYLLTV